MRKALAVCSLLAVSLPLVAAAQPPPPPPPPPGGGGATGFETPEPKMRFDVGLIAGLPQGDLEDVGVDTSPALNLIFGYTVANNISVFGAFRYFSIQIEGGNDGVELSNYDLGFGGRYAMPVSPTAKVFGEGMLIYSTLADEDDSYSGIGFAARGGGVFTVSGNIGIGGALSFSTATVDIEGIDVDAGWIGVEGFASFGF